MTEDILQRGRILSDSIWKYRELKQYLMAERAIVYLEVKDKEMVIEPSAYLYRAELEERARKLIVDEMDKIIEKLEKEFASL